MRVTLLLCACSLATATNAHIWTQPYSERIKLNDTFAVVIESVLNENKYIPEECTDIRYGMEIEAKLI